MLEKINVCVVLPTYKYNTYLVLVNPCCVQTKTKRIAKNAAGNFMVNAVRPSLFES